MARRSVLAPGVAEPLSVPGTAVRSGLRDSNRVPVVQASRAGRLHYRGREKLGTCAIRNGKIWHNNGVPNYAAVVEGPKPAF